MDCLYLFYKKLLLNLNKVKIELKKLNTAERKQWKSVILYLKLAQKSFDKCLKMSTISHDLFVFFSSMASQKGNISVVRNNFNSATFDLLQMKHKTSLQHRAVQVLNFKQNKIFKIFTIPHWFLNLTLNKQYLVAHQNTTCSKCFKDSRLKQL